MGRFEYLRGNSEFEEDDPKGFEKIKKKPKPYDDGTSRQKRDTKRRPRKKRR